MKRSSTSGNRGPMVHARRDEETHKQLRILRARGNTTIRQLVDELIHPEVDRSNRKNHR
jgi:hypothetical protein